MIATSLGASPNHPRPPVFIIGMEKAKPSMTMINVRISHRRMFSSRVRLEDLFLASFRNRKVGKGSFTFRLFCMKCKASGMSAPKPAAMRKSGARNMVALLGESPALFEIRSHKGVQRLVGPHNPVVDIHSGKGLPIFLDESFKCLPIIFG